MVEVVEVGLFGVLAGEKERVGVSVGEATVSRERASSERETNSKKACGT